jgi:hypothetical protein
MQTGFPPQVDPWLPHPGARHHRFARQLRRERHATPNLLASVKISWHDAKMCQPQTFVRSAHADGTSSVEHKHDPVPIAQ